LVREDEKVAQRIFQLAVNQAGVIRGNYYDAVADNTLPVYGSVDPKSQRAAWSVGDKKTVVFETGLNNLTQDQTTVLVHFGTDRTDELLLVRLEEPTDGKYPGAARRLWSGGPGRIPCVPRRGGESARNPDPLRGMPPILRTQPIGEEAGTALAVRAPPR